MIMKTPTPFAASKLAGDNGPLLPDGSNYPCKFGYDTEGASNVMPLGSKQQLSFIGGATHGGGSCQVSLTYDSAPTKNSVFKVIHSIVGGCPARNTAGNLGTSATAEAPDKYEFTIPNDLPPGDAVLSWTWFNKVGNREMYMNCAPVKLTGGGASKRDINNETLVARGMEAFDALPDMFVANIGNGCTTKDSTDLKFDNPGKSVDMISTTSLAGPVGNCASGVGAKGSGASDAGTKGAGAKGSGGDSTNGSGAKGSGATGAAVGSAGGDSASGTGTKGSGGDTASAADSGPKPDTPKDVPGGAFFTVSSSAEAKPTAAAQDQSAAGNQSGQKATPAISPAANPTTSPSTDNSPKSGSPSSPGSDGTSEKTVGSQCSIEGAWNCINGKSFQRCASGTWSVVMPLAAGTTCNSAISERIVIEAITKRAARAPRAHLRRHLNKIKFT